MDFLPTEILLDIMEYAPISKHAISNIITDEDLISRISIYERTFEYDKWQQSVTIRTELIRRYKLSIPHQVELIARSIDLNISMGPNCGMEDDDSNYNIVILSPKDKVLISDKIKENGFFVRQFGVFDFRSSDIVIPITKDEYILYVEYTNITSPYYSYGQGQIIIGSSHTIYRNTQLDNVNRIIDTPNTLSGYLSFVASKYTNPIRYENHPLRPFYNLMIDICDFLPIKKDDVGHKVEFFPRKHIGTFGSLIPAEYHILTIRYLRGFGLSNTKPFYISASKKDRDKLFDDFMKLHEVFYRPEININS